MQRTDRSRIVAARAAARSMLGLFVLRCDGAAVVATSFSVDATSFDSDA